MPSQPLQADIPGLQSENVPLVDTNSIGPSWASLVGKALHFPSKARLQVFAPTILDDGSVRVSLPSAVVEKGVKEWEFCLVGYYFNTRLPFSVISSILKKLWSRHGLSDAVTQEMGFVILQLAYESGMQEILEGGPWLIAG